MRTTPVRAIAAAALGLALGGCKLAVIVGEGGDITSVSGTNDCSGPGYCVIDIDDPNFTETFTAVPKPGYEFVKWQDGWGFQCADVQSIFCTVSIPPGAASAILASYDTASIRPVFNNVGIDTDGDGIRNSEDPDDDNDGVLDEDDLDPLDPNVTTTCGGAVEGVELIEAINWADQGSQTLIPLPANVVYSAQFTATANPGYGGQISVASTTGNSGVQRRIWISQCPGGEPLADPKCEEFGTSSTVVKWFQGDSHSSYCNLQPLDRYYLNHQNVNCDSETCSIYRNLYNNAEP
jgi:hypothetical protein